MGTKLPVLAAQMLPGIDVGRLLALASPWYSAGACVPGLVRLPGETKVLRLERELYLGLGRGVCKESACYTSVRKA